MIPNRNGEATLGECLEAAFKSQYGNYEVILVDDASTDGSLDIARRFPCAVVESERCLGASASRNAGAEAARGEILLFTDADILLSPDALSRIDKAFGDKNIAGVVGLLSPKLRFKDLPSQYKNLYMHTTYMKLPERISIFYTSCAAIRKKVFNACGGFDRHYRRPGIEDTEFGVRVTGKGYILRIDKGLQVEHIRHYSLWEVLRTGFRRACGVTRVVFRSRFSRRRKPKCLTSPFSFVLSIALVHLAVLLILIGLIFSSPRFMGVALVTAFCACFINAGFLNAIRRYNGWRAFAGSIPLLFLDLYAHGLGNIVGVVGYMLGGRY